MNTIRSYIIVDDDPFNNIICRRVITSTLGEVNTKTFSAPEEGLQYIQNEFINDLRPTILFLDINMPGLTGWEFMEEYKKFSEKIKKQINVYILSSSVDPRDKNRADANQSINGFLSKPLQRETILSIVGGQPYLP